MMMIPARLSFARLSSQGLFSIDLAGTGDGVGQPDGRGGRLVVDRCTMEDSGDTVMLDCDRDDFVGIDILDAGAVVIVGCGTPGVDRKVIWLITGVGNVFDG